MLIRRYTTQDRDAVMALAPRLTEGVAAWRDEAAVLAAVRAWVSDSLRTADVDGRAVFVAAEPDRLVGVVTVATRAHFSGEVDAYVGARRGRCVTRGPGRLSTSCGTA